MGIAIISENITLEKTILDGLSLLEQKGGFIPSEGKVLIAVDMLIPEPFPVSFNPDTLSVMINFLKSRGISEIYVLPIVFNRYKSDSLASNFGLAPWISDHNAILVNKSDVFDQKPTQKSEGETDPTFDSDDIINDPPKTLFSQINSILLLSQIKQDPVFGFWTSLPLLSVLNDSLKNSSQGGYQDWITPPLEFSNEKPLLVINDGFSILEQGGPFMGKSIQTKQLHRVYFGNDCLSLDWETLTDLGFDPKQNPFYSKLKEGALHSPDNIIMRIPENLAKIPMNPISKDLTRFNLPGLSLHLGNLKDDDFHSLYFLLSQFQTLLFKDFYNLGDWVILAGENPPEPICTGKEYIIVYGGSAINSTQDYGFRSLLKNVLKEPLEILGFETGITRILEGDALERAIVGKQAKIRRKNESLQSKIARQISLIEEKEPTPSLKLVKLKKEKKLEKSTINLHFKLEKIRLNLSNKHEKLRINNKAPEIVLNLKVLDLSEPHPGGLFCMQEIAHFFPLKMIPTLASYLDSMKNIYDFPDYDKKERKTQQKLLKSKLKAEITKVNHPILPQINSDLKAVKQTYQEHLQQFKQKRKSSIEEINHKYQLQIDRIKAEKKKVLKQKKNGSNSVLLPESASQEVQEDKPEGEISNE